MRKSLIKFLVAALSCGFLLTACNKKAPSEHEHIWDEGEITKQPTCHSEGLKLYKCTVPGCQQTKTENLTMTPHSWDEGRVTIAPTCSSTGEMTYTCVNEGCEQTKTVVLDKVDHKYEDSEITLIPDLLTKGAIRYDCSMCDHFYEEELEAHADFSEQFDKAYYSWKYGSLAAFDTSDIVLAPTQLVKDEDVYKDENNEVSLGHVKTNSNLILAYGFESDAEKIEVNVNIKFNGTTDTTRVNAYVVLVDSLGQVKQLVEVDNDNTKSWNYALSDENLLELAKNDNVCLILSSANEGFSEGDLSFTIKAKCIHIWNEGEVTKEATTDEEGIKEYTCIVCGEKVDHAIPKVIPEVDPLEDYFKFTGKTINRFEEGVEGNSWLTDLGHTLHVEITTPGDEIWKGGTFVNTGITFESGKAYEVSFEVSSLEENDFEIVLQNKQWEETKYETLNSPNGSNKKVIEVNDENEGTLWILVQSGNAVNEIVITKLLVKETEITPVKPGEFFVFTSSNTTGRFDGTTGKVEIDSEDPTKASVTITKATASPSDAWRGGMFINTGVSFEAGKLYNVSFQIEREEELDFEVVLQNKQWDERQYKVLSSPVGSVSEDVAPTASNEGTLWLYIRLGNTLNTITISNLKVEDKGDAPEPTNECLDLTGKIISRFDGTTGNIWLDGEDSSKAHVEITAASADVWRGGMFIDTGIAFESGKTYTVSFEIERKEELAFEVVLQNKQWDETKYTTLYSPDSPVNEEITVTDENEGTLWIYIQFGDTVNEITISKIVIEEKE